MSYPKDEQERKFGWPFEPLRNFDHVKIEMLDTRPETRWIRVVERIMTKALEHKKAGREDSCFKQVLVPMADYEALRQHFDVAGDDIESVYLSTAIGILSVHPVNPDGATFVD